MSVKVVDGIPQVEGEIKVLKHMYGQIYTKSGYKYDQMLQWFLSEIYKGNFMNAAFCFEDIYITGGCCISNFFTHMKKFCIEGIGLANPNFLQYFKEKFKEAEKTVQEPQKEILYLEILKSMCQSPKSLHIKNLIEAYMLNNPKEKPDEVTKELFKPDYEDNFEYGYQEKKGDHKKLQKYMSGLMNALDSEKIIDAVHWIEKIFNIGKYNKNYRDTYKGASKDPIYAVWEYLFTLVEESSDDELFIRDCLYFYDDIKNNGMNNRYFLVFAVLYYLQINDLPSLDNEVTISKDEFSIIKKHVKRKVPDYAVNYKTKEGRKNEKTLKDHLDSMIINNRVTNQDETIYDDLAKALQIQRKEENFEYIRKKLNHKKAKKRKRKEKNDRRKKLKK